MRAYARHSSAAFLALLLGLLTTPAWAEPLCTAHGVSIAADFETAGHHECQPGHGRRFTLSVTPESTPINPSPWYAFRVEARRRTNVRVTLAYAESEHRYAPVVSSDGHTWTRLGADRVILDADGRHATLVLDVPRAGLFVAAQPIETPASMLTWARTLLLPLGFEEITYGASLQGRPLIGFVGGGDAGDGAVIALTRQHPPETTGAAAFRAFVQRITAQDPQTRAFVASHRIILAPMPNPDGVSNGNWRQNAGGVDLNRDWSAFTQPETQALRDFLTAQTQNRRPIAFFDFHSTQQSVVYAPPLDSAAPTIDLLVRLRERMDARFAPAPRWSYNHNLAGGTSKAWALEALHAPGATIELADDAGPELARDIGEEVAVTTIEYTQHGNGGSVSAESSPR